VVLPKPPTPVAADRRRARASLVVGVLTYALLAAVALTWWLAGQSGLGYLLAIEAAFVVVTQAWVIYRGATGHLVAGRQRDR
jgi:hypothetical protein